ncbi:MAG: ribonuclease M5 [Culicoidibacterales bacterium]
MEFQEVIVVEGRDDTIRLRAYFDVDTIETNGSAINAQTLEVIREAQKQRGVIVFTDPDYPGEKIRKTIMQAIPEVKHAYLRREDCQAKNGKVGIEHAKRPALEQALQAVVTPKQDLSAVTWEQLIQLDLIVGSQAKLDRAKVAQYFHLGHVNAKQFHKRLQMFGITATQLVTYLRDLETSEGK